MEPASTNGSNIYEAKENNLRINLPVPIQKPNLPVINMIGSDELGVYAYKGTHPQAFLHNRKVEILDRGTTAIRNGGPITGFTANFTSNLQTLETVSQGEGAIWNAAAARVNIKEQRRAPQQQRTITNNSISSPTNVNTKVRVTQLDKLMNFLGRGKSSLTIAVADLKLASGLTQRVVLVNNAFLNNKKVINTLENNVKPNEKLIIFKGSKTDSHAEENVYEYAKSINAKVIQIDPSKKFCSDCETLRQNEGSTTNTGSTGKPSKNRTN